MAPLSATAIGVDGDPGTFDVTADIVDVTADVDADPGHPRAARHDPHTRGPHATIRTPAGRDRAGDAAGRRG